MLVTTSTSLPIFLWQLKTLLFKCSLDCDVLTIFSVTLSFVNTHYDIKIYTDSFLVNLGRKISERTGEPFEVRFLFQRINVLIQRFNSVLFHETFPVEDDTDT